MKQTILILAIAVCAVACKKSHTCECKTTYATGIILSNTETINDTKKQAKKTCEAKSTNPGNYSVDCELKN